MSRSRRTLQRVLGGAADAGIRFADLYQLLERLGFTARTRGSHVMFTHPDVPDLINLQSMAGMAKPYQVRQVRDTLMQHHMTTL